MKVKILGCGPSGGLPSLAYGFGNVNPNNPKNHRLRTSALILTDDGKNILIDTGPDIRTQLLSVGIPKIDAVLYTHDHYDHMGGANELVMISKKQGGHLPIYISEYDLKEFQRLLYYLFDNNIHKDLFEIHIIEPYQPFFIGTNTITPLKQSHGVNGISYGYKINNMAYTTDWTELDDKAFPYLKNLSLWILGVVSRIECRTHIHLDIALDWIKHINAQKTYLTHMGNMMDYDDLCRELPKNVYPCYDGLEIISEE